jgi:hypothetical protein
VRLGAPPLPTAPAAATRGSADRRGAVGLALAAAIGASCAAATAVVAVAAAVRPLLIVVAAAAAGIVVRAAVAVVPRAVLILRILVVGGERRWRFGISLTGGKRGTPSVRQVVGCF